MGLMNGNRPAINIIINVVEGIKFVSGRRRKKKKKRRKAHLVCFPIITSQLRDEMQLLFDSLSLPISIFG